MEQTNYPSIAPLGIHLALTSIIKFASMKVREISRAEKSKPQV